jgi:hypothetical protein
VNMAETVDLLARQVRGCRAQVLVLGVRGEVKGQPDGVDRRHLLLIVTVDLFPIQVNIPPHLPQPFDILLFRPHLSFLFPSLFEIGSSQKPLAKLD